jgi:hypothetical protein
VPESVSANVGAGQNQQPTYNVRYENYVWNPASTATPALGQIVKILTITTAQTGGDGVYTPAYVDVIAHGTLTFTFAGVVVGGSAYGVAPIVGGLTMVATQGIVQALFDNNSTTAGHLALQSAAVDGEATDSATATLGKTIGIILQSVTVSAAGTLVPILVRQM